MSLRITLLVLAAVGLGCRDGRSTADSWFAVGWEGELRAPLLMSGCGRPPAASRVIAKAGTSDGWFAATAVGDLEIRCGARDRWRIHVRRAERHEVRAPVAMTVDERS